MQFRTRHLFPATVLAGLIALSACSSDGKSADKAAATTAAAESTVAATPAPTDTVRTTDSVATDPTLEITVPSTDAGGIQYIDPTTLLQPWDGATLSAVDQATADELIGQLMNIPGATARIVATGAAKATDTTTGATTLLLFFEFDSPLSDADLTDFYNGVTDGGTEITDVNSGGHAGKAFVTGTNYSFITTFNTTAILAMSDNVDALQTTVDDMFAANPQL